MIYVINTDEDDEVYTIKMKRFFRNFPEQNPKTVDGYYAKNSKKLA